nr:MAG TPA: nucelotide kinase [Caudoviricetes sp.]
MSDIGASDKQEHYIKSSMQPIEVMQKLFSKEQFEGFLLGNILKYSMRMEYKNAVEADTTKRDQYAYWLQLARKGKTIQPLSDVVPMNFVYRGL